MPNQDFKNGSHKIAESLRQTLTDVPAITVHIFEDGASSMTDGNGIPFGEKNKTIKAVNRLIEVAIGMRAQMLSVGKGPQAMVKTITESNEIIKQVCSKWENLQ